MTGKTLAELDAQVGDVFCFANFSNYKILPNHMLKNTNNGVKPISYDHWDSTACWTLVSRAAPPVKFGEWIVAKEAPKGVSGCQIMNLDGGFVVYRCPIVPAVKTKRCYLTPNTYASHGFSVGSDCIKGSTHRIEFNLVEGVPDCDSIKMVKL